MKYFTIFIFIFYSFSGVSQDFKTELNKITNAYNDGKPHSMRAFYNLYENYATQTIFKSEEGSIKQDQLNRYYKIAYLEFLNNTKYSISINNQSKVIIVKKSKKEEILNSLPMNVDTLIAHLKKIDYEKIDANTGKYILLPNVSDYYRIDLVFNRSNFHIQKLILFKRQEENYAPNNGRSKKDKPRLEIIFEDVPYSILNSQKEYSEQRFIQITGNKMTCQPAFRNYKLINNTKSKI